MVDGCNAVSLVPRGANVPLLFELLADFALGPLGECQGLTTAELGLAWRYRHGGRVPRQALFVLSDGLHAVRGVSRQCAVTGRTLRPWVPREAVQGGAL